MVLKETLTQLQRSWGKIESLCILRILCQLPEKCYENDDVEKMKNVNHSKSIKVFPTLLSINYNQCYFVVMVNFHCRKCTTAIKFEYERGGEAD